ncbi:hypothetical protein Q2T40_17985 [Winogradskyella maritima]|uniref:NlpE C-terminal OB domain-containing protein n=1 Tax=Winogradskyella maritima TaxID=1517766 RepID=A0ABV8AE39_9FLAO|nr:hypothetical protein [Winogradskyella maritima]
MIKRLFVFSFLAIVCLGCKNEPKSEANLEEGEATASYDQNDGLITMKGEFVYFADAAVLQTANDIYGVVIDQNMHKLDEKAKAFKKEATDMVPVMVRVKKFAKPEGEEGWPFRVEIKEILKVEAPNPNQDDVIKLEN